MIRFIVLIAILVYAPLLLAVKETKKEAHADEHNHEHEEDSKKEESKASDPHTHEEHGKHEEGEPEKHAEGEHAEHEGEKHDDHSDHGDEKEEGDSKVGQGKGIEAASEDAGIKLSPQAVKSFEVTTLKVTKLPIALPNSALLFLAEDVEIYRLRGGFFKRIDFKKTSIKPLIVNSSDLVVGDEIVTGGVSFIRIAEIAAFGGAPDGHAH